MEDIELVIRIPEKIYNTVMSTQSYIFGFRSDKSFSVEILKAIRTGIPLQKGHGNLIDAKAYKEKVFRKFPCNDWDDSYIRRLTELVISDAPIIIKADKESEE